MNKWYRLRIENYLTIENAIIPLKPGPLGFVGKNAVGKTNILTALQDILSGKHDIRKIKDGADKSLIQLEIMKGDEMISCLTRRQTQSHSYLSAKGIPVDKSPSTLIADLLDRHVINPVRLLSENPVDYLKKHLPSKLDPEDIKDPLPEGIEVNDSSNGFEVASNCASFYEQIRRETGRQVREAKNIVDNMKTMLPSPPEVPLESKEEIDKLESNLYIMKGKVEGFQKWKKDTLLLVKEQEEEINKISKELEVASERKHKLEDQLKSLPNVVSKALNMIEMDKQSELNLLQDMYHKKDESIERQIEDLRNKFERDIAVLNEKKLSFGEQLNLRKEEILKRYTKDSSEWEAKKASLEVDYRDSLDEANQVGLEILRRKRRCESNIEKYNKDIETLENNISSNYDFDKDFNTISTKKAQWEEVFKYRDLESKINEKEKLLNELENKHKMEDDLFKYYNYDLVKKLIAKSSLPVEGVEFRDSELFVNGRHIDRLSTAERSLIAMQLSIALAESKGHIAICMDGIEYFDEEHRKAFLDAAEKSKVCVLYTRYSENTENLESCELPVENGTIISS